MAVKRKRVVMFPTNEESSLYLHDAKGLHLLAPVKHEQGMYNGENQHLYLLSSEEIKEDDWYCSPSGIISKMYEGEKLPNGWKKIIATTDLSIVFHKLGKDEHVFIPTLPQDFIEVFVEEYNKGNVIKWVYVEYDYEFDGDGNKITTLRINSRNQVQIKKIDINNVL